MDPRETVLQPVFRFAPSPNGLLHLGHAFSALLNEELAARFDGRLLLRIEDIDVGRTRPEFVAAIREDLDWLGIRFDGEPRRQSEHFDDYRAAASRLRERGLLFRCACTRGELAAAVGPLAPRDPDGTPLYPGTCRRCVPAPERPHAERLAMDRALAAAGGPVVRTSFDAQGRETHVACDPARWGDAVLVRKDVPTSYHLSVVLDDAVQGVTHVVRGKDLEAATDLHRLLQTLLGLPAPRCLHHDLVTDDTGEKLAKSRFSKPLREWRREGAAPEDIRRMLGFGQKPMPRT